MSEIYLYNKLIRTYESSIARCERRIVAESQEGNFDVVEEWASLRKESINGIANLRKKIEELELEVVKLEDEIRILRMKLSNLSRLEHTYPQMRIQYQYEWSKIDREIGEKIARINEIKN